MSKKNATLYRMVTDEHICPYGIKSKDLLERENYSVEDHQLKNRKEIDHFKAEHNVETTPQTFIDGQRVGGFDDLQKFFGKSIKGEGETTYAPINAIFGTTALMSGAVMWARVNSFNFLMFLELFIAFSMCALAIQKLKDLDSFSNQFITYDILGRRWVRYSYIYPFAEMIAGVGMLSMILPAFFGLISVVIGTIGAISVVKAVYIEKRDLKCACVGGDSNVPLGAISLTENVMMMLMGLWMIFHYAM